NVQLRCGSPSTYCPTNSSGPIPVDLGYSSSSPVDPLHPERTMSAQTACLPGHFCDGSGGAKLCAPGTATNVSAQSECQLCDIGKYAASPGALECLDCPAGKIANDTGSSYCISCFPGTERNTDPTTGVAECLPCLPGSA